MNPIILIDDDLVFLKLTSQFLRKNGYQPEIFSNWKSAKAYLEKNKTELALVDLHLPEISGIQIISEMKKIEPGIPILMITAHSSIATAIESVKAGAEDYIQKPCENSEILFKIQRIFEQKKKEEELKKLQETISGQFRFHTLITKDEETKKTYQLAATAADLDILIYIRGETGTGKEMLTKAIHSGSSRVADPFVVVNCAAMNENLVESELFGHKKGSFTSAHTDKKGRCETVGAGTLLIDEVGELSFHVQKKLLRLLQEKEFESLGSTEVKKFRGRVIAASHRDLNKMVREGHFREDLYFRLNVFPLHLKPLRERQNDLMDLAQTFLNRYSTKFGKPFSGFSPEVTKTMMHYSWPGNIRELEHFVERQVLISQPPTIDSVDIGTLESSKKNVLEEPHEIIEFSDFMKEKGKLYFMALLKEHKGSIEKAAEKAGIHRKTLYMKMKEYGLDKREYREE
jgi:two-component system response regulator AtoC